MKFRNVFGLMLFFMVLLVAAGPGIAGEPQSTESSDVAGVNASPGATAPWFISEVDSGPRVGSHVSVAIDDNGTTYISYYDSANKYLKMAKYVGWGGNCGPDNDWLCETVDNSGDVGQYSSIAVDPTTNLPVIAYWDIDDNELMLATAWGGGWEIMTLAGPMAGTYASLKIDSTGAAHIAYYRHGGVGLRYARYVGGGAGNCGEGNYQCDTIDGGNGVGYYPSLALDNSGQPRIAYYNTNYDDLWYAQPDIAGNCGTGNSWNCYQVSTAGDVGQYASLDVDDSNISHLAYYDATNGKLMYAVYVGSGGNCVFPGLWQCEEIGNMGAQGTHQRTRDVSLAVDKAGFPIIAYSWYYGSPYSIRGFSRARPAAALGLQSGNCGPQNLWQCDGIEGGFSTGNYSAIAVNPSGLATIAYNYNHSGTIFEGALRIAEQRFHRIYLPSVMNNQYAVP